VANDIRYAFRTFLKAPGFTAVAVVTLALGIGANTAIFSIVNGVLLRPLPYPHAREIVEVYTTSAGEPKSAHAAADFLEFRRDNRSFALLAGYREDALTVIVAGSDPVRVSGTIVTAEYFDVFGTSAEFGRTFTRDRDSTPSEPLIVLSHALWLQQFASDATIVGRTVKVNGIVHTIAGVMPATFAYPEGSRAWVLSQKPVPPPPLDIQGDLLESRGVHFFKAIGRLKPGVTPAQARADLAVIAEDQARRFPDTNGGRGVALEPLQQRIVGDVRDALYMLLGSVAIVLLIACANIASLLLARASGRRREIAVRVALGAGRARLIRQLITESLLLGLLGAGAGLLVGSWAVAFILKVLPDGVPRADEITLDAGVMALAIFVSLACSLLFGLAPALQVSRVDAVHGLREAERGTSTARVRARTRSALVIIEVALTLVLLVSAGLLANSLIRLERVDPGFLVDPVAVITLPLPQSKYRDGKAQAAFYGRIADAIRSHREVESAAILFPSPIEGRNASGTFSIEGQTSPNRADRPFASIASVSGEYFRTLGIPLIIGRTFTDQDRDPAPAVIVVNTTLVRKYFPDTDPIGKKLKFGDTDKDWMTIVGVVGDSRNVGVREAPAPLVYMPYTTFPLPFMAIAVRSNAPVSTIAALARTEISSADPELAIAKVEPMRDVLRESVAEPRFRTQLLVGFAALAMVLAAVGIYGLVSYSVVQRTREIGIRMALGAQARQVMGPVLRQGMQLAGAGIGLGLAGSVVAARLVAKFLFGIEPFDPFTYTLVSALLFLVTLMASFIPSRRALRVDPLTALRSE
jgi:putative ABC transport system permease protein